MPPNLYDQIAVLIALCALIGASVYERRSFARWLKNLIRMLLMRKASPESELKKDRRSPVHLILFPMVLGGLFTFFSWALGVFLFPHTKDILLMPLSGLGLAILLSTVYDITPKFSLLKIILRAVAGMLVVSGAFIVYLSLDFMFDQYWFVLFYSMIAYGMVCGLIIAYVVPDLNAPVPEWSRKSLPESKAK